MCCVDDELAVLRELARVLRPGGLLLMADHVESSARLGRGVQWVLERVSPDRAGEHFRRRPLLLLEPAGLELVESDRVALAPGRAAVGESRRDVMSIRRFRRSTGR